MKKYLISLPKCADPLLLSQSNIAEGCGRNSAAGLKRFFVIVAGSSSELQFQLMLCKDLGYLAESIFKELHDEFIQIRKMINRDTEQLKADSR